MDFCCERAGDLHHRFQGEVGIAPENLRDVRWRDPHALGQLDAVHLQGVHPGYDLLGEFDDRALNPILQGFLRLLEQSRKRPLRLMRHVLLPLLGPRDARPASISRAQSPLAVLDPKSPILLGLGILNHP